MNGNSYVYTFPLSGGGSYVFRFKNKVTGEVLTRSRIIGTPVNYLIDFDSMRELPDGIKVSENSEAFINTDGNWENISLQPRVRHLQQDHGRHVDRSVV